MSNLIQYIVQEDPEEELKKKQSQTLLSRELSSPEDTDKNYKFNSRHLLENDFSHLQSKPAPTARSYLSQALAKNVAKEGNKVNSALSPKPIGNDAASYKIAQNNKTNIANDANSYKLGTLSGKAESDNGKKIFNNCNADKTGGCSYGTYQIETKKGTMKDYLNYLNQNPNYQGFYNSLQKAGGYEGSLSGTNIFKGTWKELSNNSDFLKSQHDFIVASKLNPALKRMKDIKGLDFDKRSPVLKDVLFSTATQHGQGGASDVFHNALGDDVSNLTDEEIINKIYNERKKVDKYFSKSSPETQDILKNVRFPEENAKALELLKRYQR